MTEKLKVVICWHMHQPNYYDVANQLYHLPWTYLHGIKDYIDMAAHLEKAPKARVVVNFAPTLLEQLDDYVSQVQNYLQNPATATISDPLLHALATPNLPDEPTKRFELIESCLRANQQHIIQRFKPFEHLSKLADWLKAKPEFVTYLDEQFLIDLLMWYHLGWMGETIRRQDQRVKALMDKEYHYNAEDRLQLLTIIGETLGSIVPRFKALADKGQVELSFTPYAHPIMPLLLDLHSAREAVPDASLPKDPHYPGGKERVIWHLHQGLAVFKKYFGRTPQGCWPSEGSVSEATVRLLESEMGIRWVATGQGVLTHSLHQSQQEGHPHYPYCLHNSRTYCFFRDDGLSDNIGFRYANWHANDAVGDLLHHLENIANAAPHTGAKMVSMALDGENAWEYYPENGYYFLTELYERLANHPKLEMTTFSDCLNIPAKELKRLVAGSWVYGSFSTWIGDKDKNRGWDMLIEAKKAYDEAYPNLSPERKAEAERQLAICEGSDWCWWFGDYNPSHSVELFDQLYRLHLTNLYKVLNKTPPDYLQHAFSHGTATGDDVEMGGMMRRGQEEKH